MKHMKMSVAIRDFEAHLLARRLAPNTVKNAKQVLTRAMKEWGDILVSSIEPRHIDRLFTAGGWGPTTQNLYLGQLRTFFKWARVNGYLPKDFDPTATWGTARTPRNKDRDRIPAEMFEDLLDAAPHPRDRAIVALGLYTFSRGSELSTLKIHDLDLGEGLLHVRRHKTLDEDSLPVSEELAREMVRYLNWYRQDQGTLVGHWYLVPAKQPDLWKQDKVTRRLVKVDKPSSLKPTVMETKPYRAVQRALRALGLPSHSEGVHTLRRSAARAYADNLRTEGYDGALLRVASFLGHRSTKVTEQYIGWGLERDQRNAMVKGKPMFPTSKGGGLLKVVGDGSDRD